MRESLLAGNHVDAMDLSTVRGRVLFAMGRRGLNAAELSRLTKLDPSRLSRFLSGKKKTDRLGSAEVAALSTALDLEMKWLLAGTGHPVPGGNDFPREVPDKIDRRRRAFRGEAQIHKAGELEGSPMEALRAPPAKRIEAEFLKQIDERYHEFAVDVIKASQAHPETRDFPLMMRWETLESMAAKRPMEGHSSAEWFHMFRKALIEGPDVRIQLEPEEDQPVRRAPKKT